MCSVVVGIRWDGISIVWGWGQAVRGEGGDGEDVCWVRVGMGTKSHIHAKL